MTSESSAISYATQNEGEESDKYTRLFWCLLELLLTAINARVRRRQFRFTERRATSVSGQDDVFVHEATRPHHSARPAPFGVRAATGERDTRNV